MAYAFVAVPAQTQLQEELPGGHPRPRIRRAQHAGQHRQLPADHPGRAHRRLGGRLAGSARFCSARTAGSQRLDPVGQTVERGWWIALDAARTGRPGGRHVTLVDGRRFRCATSTTRRRTRLSYLSSPVVPGHAGPARGRETRGRGAEVTVAVVFTGGTIASRVDPAAGGAVPALRGADILARTPGLADADIEVIDWGLVTASHMGFGPDAGHRPAAGRDGRPAGDQRRRRGPGNRHDRGDQLRLRPAGADGQADCGNGRHAQLQRGRLRRSGQSAQRGGLRERRRVGRSGCGRCAQRFDRGCRSGGQDPRHGVGHVPASRWASAGNGGGWRGGGDGSA